MFDSKKKKSNLQHKEINITIVIVIENIIIVKTARIEVILKFVISLHYFLKV